MNTSAQDDLNYLKKENINIKDKEKNLLDIFAMLKKFVQVDVDTTPTSPKPNSDASAGPNILCEKCNFVTTNIELLNKHVREEHIVTKYPCLICDYQAESGCT